MISSRPLCMQNIFNTIQTQNRTLGITSWQKTLLVPYDMKSACGKVLNPNMNASKTKEKPVHKRSRDFTYHKCYFNIRLPV